MDIAAFKPHLAAMFGEMFTYAWDAASGLYLVTANHILAWAEAPQSISEGDLPMWILFTRQATYPVPPDSSALRLLRETRDFDCRLYVALGQAGIDGEAERKCEPYIETARLLIQTHPLLQEDTAPSYVPGIQRGYPVRDSGVVTLSYGSPANSYVGLNFTIRVDALNPAPVYQGGQ